MCRDFKSSQSNCVLCSKSWKTADGDERVTILRFSSRTVSASPQGKSSEATDGDVYFEV